MSHLSEIEALSNNKASNFLYNLFFFQQKAEAKNAHSPLKLVLVYGMSLHGHLYVAPY